LSNNKSNFLSQAITFIVPVEVQNELKDVTPHRNFSMFVCLKAEWYCSFLLLVFGVTPQALEAKEPPAVLQAWPGAMEMSLTPMLALPSRACSPPDEQMRGNPRQSELAAVVDEPHIEHGKGGHRKLFQSRGFME